MNTHKKFFSKIGFSYLTFEILSLISALILVNCFKVIYPPAVNNINSLIIITSLCNYIIPLPIFLYLMKKLEKSSIEKKQINLKTYIIYICISILLMWIGNMIGGLITNMLSGVIQNPISNPIQNIITSSNILLNIILISFIAPIFEEFIFRKWLIDRTIKYGARISIIISALIFGLYHGNLNQFFYAALLGAFLAYIYIKTGKITYTISLHMIVNFFGSVLSLIITKSVNNILQGLIVPTDIAVVIIYFAIMLISIVVGTYYLCKYKQAKFNGSKTLIELKNPLKTIILNPGMLCFIGFFIFVMIRQIINI